MPVAIDVVPVQVAQLADYGERSRRLTVGRAVDALGAVADADADADADAEPAAVYLPSADAVRAHGYIAGWAVSQATADGLDVAPDRYLRSLSRTADTVRLSVPSPLLDALGFTTGAAAWESGPAWCGRCGYPADSEHGVRSHHGLVHDGDPYVRRTEPAEADLVGEGPLPETVAASTSDASATAGTESGTLPADGAATFVVSVGVEEPLLVFEPARSRSVVAPDRVGDDSGSAVVTDGGGRPDRWQR